MFLSVLFLLVATATILAIKVGISICLVPYYYFALDFLHGASRHELGRRQAKGSIHNTSFSS
jgi:hypothetical protein